MLYLKKNENTLFYLFSLLYLFVLLLIVRLFLICLFLFDSIYFFPKHTDLDQTVVLKPRYNPNRKKV